MVQGDRRSEAVAVIGCGSMGSALIRGFSLRPDRRDIVVVTRSPERVAERLRDVPVTIADTVAAESVQACGMILLAVKPQVLRDIAPSLAPHCQGKAVVSVAAGLGNAYLEAAFAGAALTVRALPNLAVARGLGVTVLSSGGRALSPADRERVQALFEPTGGWAWVETDAEMDVATAVSGSGLAYVYAFIEALAATSTQVGLPPDLARRLAERTLAGSSALADDLEQMTRLKRAVTSPAGTTAAALAVLEGEQGLTSLLSAAVVAAVRRARELGAPA